MEYMRYQNVGYIDDLHVPNTFKHFLEGLAIAGSGNIGCGSVPLMFPTCKKSSFGTRKDPFRRKKRSV
jgi:hypothetical protein